jgi:hypothetical protein
MKRTTLTMIYTIIAFSLFAQDYQVPQNLKLNKAEDYAQYEQDVINCVNWLMKTPVQEQANKRKEANAFLMKWLTGSPNVQIEIKEKIVTFMKSSPDLLMVFMGGWAKYSLESRDFKNKVFGNLAGIDAIIEFYTKNKSKMPKDKNVEKYIKMRDKGTLKEFVEKNA